LHFRLLNDAEIAKSKRDFELKKAAYDVEVQTKKAEAELAYELQAAKTKQRIKDEQMQIKVVERTQEILVQVITNFQSFANFRVYKFIISFSSSNTQFYISRIFCLFTL
jgi:hypothetical protein